MKRAVPTLALAAAAALVWAAPAQDFDALRERIRSSPELVVVPVTVKDARGEFVLDIRAEEFRIFDGGVEQQLEFYTLESFPLSAVILLDSALPARTAERLSPTLGAIAGSFGPWDEAAVAQFAADFYTTGEFKSGGDDLLDSLARINLSGLPPPREIGPPTGPTVGTPRPESTPQARPTMSVQFGGRRGKHLDDAMAAAAEMLAPRPRDRRKILLVITDGANARQNLTPFDAALRRLLDAEAAVYAINVGGRALSERGAGALERYARMTGGALLNASEYANLEAAYARALEQARTQYTLAYVPRRQSRAHGYRALEIRVRRPGLRVIARDGYYPLPLLP